MLKGAIGKEKPEEYTYDREEIRKALPIGYRHVQPPHGDAKPITPEDVPEQPSKFERPYYKKTGESKGLKPKEPGQFRKIKREEEE